MKSISRRVCVASFFLSSALVSGAVWADNAPTSATAPAAAAPAAAAPAGSVTVVKAVLTSGLQDHDPAAEITTAKVGDVVVGWNQLASDAVPVKVHHKWMHEGQLVSDVVLDVKASPYRTWSRKTMSEPGAWKWQITNDAGDVLKETAFTVSQ